MSIIKISDSGLYGYKSKVLSLGLVMPSLEFPGGNVTQDDIKTFAELLATYGSNTPKAGGTLTLNSVALGSYDYRVYKGNHQIETFSDSDWFTSTEDARSAWIVFNGNLIIDAGQTFIPTKRKLFTVLYVSGNLTISGGISMTAKGSNHRGDGESGGAVTAAAIRIATGTFSEVENPQIPAAGGAGGSFGSAQAKAGVAGTAGTAGATGGGGTGASGSGTITGGNGAAGTSFSGGPAGGGAIGVNGGEAGETNGGKGGRGNATTSSSGGGAGNPGGIGGATGGDSGQSGTGGILVIICAGVLSGDGVIAANGKNGGNAIIGGGGSGGGSVTVMYGTDDSSITPTAAGGAGGTGTVTGGNGGAGTARKLALA